jgi:hypothetical protein
LLSPMGSTRGVPAPAPAPLPVTVPPTPPPLRAATEGAARPAAGGSGVASSAWRLLRVEKGDTSADSTTLAAAAVAAAADLPLLTATPSVCSSSGGGAPAVFTDSVGSAAAGPLARDRRCFEVRPRAIAPVSRREAGPGGGGNDASDSDGRRRGDASPSAACIQGEGGVLHNSDNGERAWL